MNKIKISRISRDVYSQKGFDEHGCIGCQCKDMCCREGADVDKEAYDLILKHKDRIERISNIKFEDFFEHTWSGDTDFLGGNSIRSKVGTSGYCVFRIQDNKGCVLFKLVMEDGVSRRIIPSICRLFPVTWDNETLAYYERKHIPSTCNCLELSNTTERSIFETQQEAIEDILDIRS